MSGTTVRFASYNLHDLKDDVPAMVRVIQAIDPDVLLLQEVPRRLLAAHRVSALAARCGMYWSGRHRGSGGTTVFTSLRVDAVEVSHHRLPVAGFSRTRGYAVARVRRPGHLPLTALSLHLSLDAAERLRHTRHILDAHGQSERLLVVGGDLNETSDGAAWQLLAQRLQPVTPDAPTFSAGRPRRRIDAIFAGEGLSVGRGRPVACKDADVAAASDHRPVWVDLTVPALPVDG